MQIRQADARTVRIETEGLAVLLRYSLFQNGDERPAESITCSGAQTVAYFLTATIRDSLADLEGGFAVFRRWSVIPEGELALSFCLDFPALRPVSCLFPGMASFEGVPKEGRPVDGRFTALPNAVCLFEDRRAVLIFSDPPRSPLDHGSVELSLFEQEEERFLRVRVRFPPDSLEAPAGKPGRAPRAQSQPLLRSAGNFEHGARLNVLVVPASELFQRGTSAFLARLSEAAPGALQSASAKDSEERIRDDLRAGLERLLVRKAGICGARAASGASELSAEAGAGLAFLLCKLFPNDEEQLELALQMADFCLRAQHPGGLFYQRFSLPRGLWLESMEQVPSIEVRACSITTRYLLELAGLLRARGLPHGRYLHAASRASSALYAGGRRLSDAACLLDVPGGEPLARGIEVLAVAEPLGELLRQTGKDQYRKALAAFRDKFFPARPPGAAAAAWPEVGRQSTAALRLARSAVLLSESGLFVPDLESLFSALLPWVYLNVGGSPGTCNPMGGILEALGTNRLLFRGFEVCYVLSRLDALIPSPKPLDRLQGLLPQIAAFSLQQPPGTAFFSLADPPARAFGPVEARVMASELYFRLKLLEEHPELARRRPDHKP